MEALTKYEKIQFQMVAEERLVGMYVIVFIRQDYVKFVKNVITSNVGCGIMGTLGNKGAVAVRFTFHESTFCCICSHLAAHQVA